VNPIRKHLLKSSKRRWLALLIIVALGADAGVAAIKLAVLNPGLRRSGMVPQKGFTNGEDCQFPGWGLTIILVAEGLALARRASHMNHHH